MAKKTARMSDLHKRIAALLKEHPEGLSDKEMQEQLGIEQNQFQRRRRELGAWYELHRIRQNGKHIYRLGAQRAVPLDSEPVSARLRAEVIMRAHGRCQMCGKSVAKDGISLVVDHLVPRDWGGLTTLENLWATCEECNGGKKNYFASFDPELMRRVMAHQSVHMRIGELLIAMAHHGAPSYLLQAVAGQIDWRRRLRQLRYLGWEYEAVRNGPGEFTYKLIREVPWMNIKYPNDPTRSVGEHERTHHKRRK